MKETDVESRHNLDDKFRLAIPAEIREEIGERYVLTVNIGGDPCLDLYSMGQWSVLMDKIRNLRRSDINARHFERYFVGARDEGTFDKQGRLLIPANLRIHAKLVREVDIIPLINSVELWDAQIKRDELTSFNPQEIIAGLDI